MLIADSKRALLASLAQAGVTPGRIASDQVPVIVDAFRQFVLISAEHAAPPGEDGDGVVAQYGTYAFSGPRQFEADLTRQLTGAGEEDPTMWQVSCTLRWDPSEETDAMGSGNTWSFGVPWEAFFAQVLELPGWAWAHETHRPATLVVDLGGV